MAQESVLRIVIDSRNAERNAHALANELESIEKNGNFATKSMDSMSVATRQLAGYMAGIVTIGAAINRMDAYTSINNKLKLVTNSQTELNQAMQDTFAIAQRSASSWSAVNDVYSKYMSNAKTLNLTQEQTARLTEITSKAVAISGSTTESAAGALFQYGQALDGNILRGEEYNALVDGAGGLLSAMAKGLNVTRGELRQMMLDGKLTGEVITKALLKAGDSVDELYAKTDVTIGQSLTVLSDSITKFTGEASTGSGAATVLAGSIRTLAENLDLVVGGSIVLGIGYITTAIATKTIAVKADITATLAQRAATQAQAIEEVKLATAAVNDAKAHLALTQATAAATQAKFGATAAATKYKMATDAVTQAVLRQEIAEKAAYGATVNMSRASAGLLGFLGGPVGIGLTLATVAAGYILMRDNASKATASIDIQGQSVDNLISKYQELNTLQRDNETKALADQVQDLTVKFRVASSDLTSFMQALPVSDEKINTWSKLHSQFSLGKISSDDYYKSIKALNILNDEQLSKVGGLIVKYESSNTKMKEAEIAQNALAAATKKTTTDIKDQAVSITKLSDEIKKLLKEADKNSVTSTVTATLASRGYNDDLISIVNKYITVEGAITKNLQGQSVFRDEIKAKIEQEYTAVMKAKNATDARNEAEKKITKEKERQAKFTEKTIKSMTIDSVIARGEGNYNSFNKGKAGDSVGSKLNLVDMTVGQIRSLQKNGSIFAAGKYQAIPSTLQGAIDAGIVSTAEKFNAEVQERIVQQYLLTAKKGRGNIEDYIKGKSDNLTAANIDLSKEFASVANPLTGKSYYDGDKAGNKARISVDDAQNALKASRELYAQAIASGKSAQDAWKAAFNGSISFVDGSDLQKDLDKFVQDNLKKQEENKQLQSKYDTEAIARGKARDEEILQANILGQAALVPKIKERYEAQDELAKLQQEFEVDGYKWTEERKLQYTRDTNILRLTAEGKFSEDQKKIFEKGYRDQYDQELAFIVLAKEQRIFQYKQALMTEAELVRERYRIEMLELSKIVDIEERRIAMQSKTTAFIRGGLAPVGTTPIESDKGKSNTQLLQEETGRELLAMQNRHLAAQLAAKDNAKELLRIEKDYIAAKEQLHTNHDIKLVDARKADHDNQLQLYGQMLSQASTVWGDMTQMIKDAKGENSKTFKAMFLAQQSMAIAQQIINTELAAGATTAQTGIFGLPAASVIRGIGYASVGLIAAQTIAGFETGGYTGSGGRKDVAGVVHGQEYVLNAAATKRVGVGTLDAINSGKSLGGATVVQPKVVINNYSSEKVETSTNSDGELMVTIGKMMDQKIDSGVDRGIQRNLRQGHPLANAIKGR